MYDFNKEIQQISNWIQESVLMAKAKGVVLGLSGGVDSAVAAALCKKAFPDNTLCLTMPCYSDSIDEEHALIIADKLNLEIKKVELDGLFDVFRELVDSPPFDSKFALGNIKSRLRMITLNYFAAKNSYLVVGPTNKSEFTIGYFTKHGDSGVDIMPIADYAKNEIYKLAEHLDIPKIIIEKVPTAGLWDGQTDEDEMKMTYKQLDDYITYGTAEDSIKARIEMMNGRSEHKRDFPKIYKRKEI